MSSLGQKYYDEVYEFSKKGIPTVVKFVYAPSNPELYPTLTYINNNYPDKDNNIISIFVVSSSVVGKVTLPNTNFFGTLTLNSEGIDSKLWFESIYLNFVEVYLNFKNNYSSLSSYTDNLELYKQIIKETSDEISEKVKGDYITPDDSCCWTCPCSSCASSFCTDSNGSCCGCNC